MLLNANVAFLAIQSVDEGGGTAPDQISSYISAIMSVGSALLGLLLVRRRKHEKDVRDILVRQISHVWRDDILTLLVE